MRNLISDELTMYFDKLICGIMLVKMSDRRIAYINKKAEEMLEASSNEVVGHICHEFVCPAKLNECPIIDLKKEVDNSEKILLRDQKFSLDIIKTVSKISIGDEIYLLESFVDISPQKKLEKETKLLGMTDALTGLYNRRYLNEEYYEMLHHASFHKEHMTAIMMDIDYFKKVNDIYGHLSGDQVLSQIGKIIMNRLRADDVAIRWGGEEFLILLKNTNQEQAHALAESIRKIISNFDFAIKKNVTVSLGISELMQGESYEHWINRADYSLLRAKSEGRNCSIVWNGYIGLDEMIKELKESATIQTASLGTAFSHNTLIEKSRQVIQSCIDAGDTGESSNYVCHYIEALINHFKDEEVFLESIKYPGVQRHIDQHRVLEKALFVFKKDCCDASKKIDDLKMYKIGEQLIFHLKEENINIVNYLNNNE